MKARTVCLYGDSGEGKSTQLYFLCTWLWETYKLKSRLISYDGKYQQFQLKLNGKPSLEEQGAVDIMDCSALEFPLAATRMLSEGYWKKFDKKGGKWVFLNDPRFMTMPQEWEGIGAYMIEGISPLCDIWLAHIADLGVGKGQGGMSVPWSYEQEGYKISGNSDTHYGVIQKELTKVYKQGFHNFPCRFVISTALVEKGIESYRRKKVPRGQEAPVDLNATTLYGPKAAGQALTPFIPGWFADVFHLDRVETEKYGEIRVAYYKKHPHPTTDVNYLCRVDVLPEHVVQLEEKWKGGFIPLTGDKKQPTGIQKFYQFLEITGG